MIRECDSEVLEALVRGQLDGETAQAVAQHAAGCAACRDELSWLRAEAELMARKKQAQPSLSPSLWEGIARRIAEPEIVTPPLDARTPASDPLRSSSSTSLPSPSRRWHWGARVVSSGLVAAAAAALLFVAWPHGPAQRRELANSLGDAAMMPSATRSHKKLTPDATLTQAEQEYQAALKVLEAQYKAERGHLPPTVARRYDSMLEQTRTRVAGARIAAGNDVEGRLVVLDGYAEYLRSLQLIVSDIR